MVYKLDSARINFLDILQYINNLDDAVVYSIIDKKSSIGSINYTLNFKSKLGEIAKLMSGCSDLVLDYRSISLDPVYKLIMAQRYKKELESRGYKFLQQDFIKYSVHMRFSDHQSSMIVYIKSPRGKRTIVGIFKTLLEGEEFIKQYYPEHWDGLPIYAINYATRRYYTGEVRPSRMK